MRDVKHIFLKAIAKYGKEAQTDMMIEEMSELTKALLKYRRYPSDETIENIREEMADVKIMFDQMEMIYGDYTEYAKYTRAKITRLASRLGIDESADAGGSMSAT